MFEASVCHGPNQPDALFIMSKANEGSMALDTLTDMRDMVLQMFAFSPTVFDVLKAEKWLRSHGFITDERLRSEDGELVYLQLGPQCVEPGTLRSVKLDRGIQAFVGVPCNSEIGEIEKTKILELTSELLGCSVSEDIGEDDMKTKKVLTKAADEKPVESVEVKAAIAVQDVVATPTEVVTPEVVTPDVKTVEIPDVEKPGAAVSEVKAEVKAEDVKAEVVAKAEAVEPEVKAEVKAEDAGAEVVKAEATPEVKPETKRDPLDNEAVVDKISSLTAQQVSTVLTASMGTLLAPLQKMLGTLSEAVTKMLSVTEASAQAVSNVISAQAKRPVLAKSKAIETVTESESEVVKTLNGEISQLKGMVTTMMKSATNVPEHDEGPVKKTERKSPNDVFGPNWPFCLNR